MVTNNRWQVTKKQRTMLTEWVPEYKAEQAKKSLVDFWPRVFLVWFQRWPATAVAPQGLVEKVSVRLSYHA